MYRDDWEAAVQRAGALESELSRARGQQDQDAQRIAHLEAQLKTAVKAIESLRNSRAMAGYPQPYHHHLPSNATTVLVLGILSLALCSVLGPFAWHSGNEELARIRAGAADPTRSSMVQAGRVLGIIATSFLIITLSVVFIAVVAM
jgi:hypothetical protein